MHKINNTFLIENMVTTDINNSTLTHDSQTVTKRKNMDDMDNDKNKKSKNCEDFDDRNKNFLLACNALVNFSSKNSSMFNFSTINKSLDNYRSISFNAMAITYENVIMPLQDILAKNLGDDFYSFLTEQQISENSNINKWPEFTENVQILFRKDCCNSHSQHFTVAHYNKTSIVLYKFCNGIPFPENEILRNLHPYYFKGYKHITIIDTVQDAFDDFCSLKAVLTFILCIFKVRPNNVSYNINNLMNYVHTLLISRKITIFPFTFCSINFTPRTPFNIDEQTIIKDGRYLNDNHINLFLELLSSITTYRHVHTLSFLGMNRSRHVFVDKKDRHIQILNITQPYKHWILTYYNLNSIHIYDSLNQKDTLYEELKVALALMHPYCLQENMRIYLNKVTHQLNGVDCGVFAIAFATSIAFGYEPSTIDYDHANMRNHLYNMFVRRNISHFPTQKKPVSPNLPFFNNAEGNDNNLIHSKGLLISQQGKLQYIVDNDNGCNTKSGDNHSKRPVQIFENDDHIQSEEVKLCKRRKLEAQKEILFQNNKEINENRTLVNNYKCTTEYSETIFLPEKGNDDLKKFKNGKLDKWLRENYVIDVKEKLITNLIDSCIEEKDYTDLRIRYSNVVEWSIHILKRKISLLKKECRTLKRLVDTRLQNVENVPLLDIDTFTYALCGHSQHTVSTEPYFNLYPALIKIENLNYIIKSEYRKKIKENNSSSKDCDYDSALQHVYKSQNILDSPIAMSHDGVAVNIFVPINNSDGKIWQCHDVLCSITKNPMIVHGIFSMLHDLSNTIKTDLHDHIEQIFACSNKYVDSDHLGHPEFCYVNYASCSSKTLPIIILSSHFPILRTILKQLYCAKSLFKSIESIEKALFRGDYEILQDFISKFQNIEVTFPVKPLAIDESSLRETYKKGIKLFTNIASDLPTKACFSCERLQCSRNLRSIERYKDTLENSQIWTFLSTDSDRLVSKEFLCSLCFNNIVHDKKIPSYSIVNNLSNEKVPGVLQSLNDAEKMLISRARSFQTIKRMGTVMTKKNMPNNHNIKKVCGRVFHLPLPIEKTLEKLCNEKDPLNMNPEFFILVRGIPNKSNKIVWENLVDMSKVFESLVWLKKNNHLYENIALPDTVDELGKILDNMPPVEYQSDQVTIEIDKNIEDHKENGVADMDNVIVSLCDKDNNSEKKCNAKVLISTNLMMLFLLYHHNQHSFMKISQYFHYIPNGAMKHHLTYISKFS